MLINLCTPHFNATIQHIKNLVLNLMIAAWSVFSSLIKVSILAVFSIAVSACATPDTKQKTVTVEKTITTETTVTTEKTTPVTTQTSSTSTTIDSQIVGAVTSPLSDLNLIRSEISPFLVAAVKGPYLPLADKSCDAIVNEVRGLDSALGPDLDAPAGVDPDLFEKGSAELGNAAVGALRRTVDGAIPFRSWIRKFSGAEKHSREVSTAVAAGIVRRSFLKGLGQASGCQAPAAPRS